MDQKPDISSAGGAKTEDAHLWVQLKVKNQADQIETCFKIKKAAPLKKMMEAYALRQGINVKLIK
jgi:hypothetical protein